MSANAVAAGSHSFRVPLQAASIIPIRIVHAWIGAPALMFLLGLTAMLFRPPDLKAFPIDRLAFVVLVGGTGLSICVRRERLRTFSATWPLLALMLLALWGVVSQPYEPEAWSLLAAKWIVPFVLFHIAGVVFDSESALRKLEIFSLCVLAYLSLISVFFLADARSWIFPRFILNGAIGIHADRARGPFLQAVANGVCINLLGLIALDSFRRRRLRGWPAGLLFVTIPFALLATKTRAVWVGAAISVLFLVCFGSGQRVRRAAFAIGAIAVAGVGCALLYQGMSGSLTERFEDRSPVDFRTEMYEGGWQMFTEKPLLGWGNQASIQPEIAKRVSTFHPEYYVFHNTYLEIAVERGLLGLGLYAWLMVSLFRLGSKPRNRSVREGKSYFLDSQFLRLWPLLLGVYLLNASAVVMNYQFVNGFLFTIAGILAAQRRNTCEAIS